MMKRTLLKLLLGVAILISPMILNAQATYTETFETDADIANWSHHVGANQFTTETHNPTGGVGGTGALELGDGGFGFLDEHAISATIGDYYELTLDVKTQGWDDQATYPIFVTIEGMDANPNIAYINGLTDFTTITLVGKVTNATGYIRIEGSNTSGANLVTIDNITFTNYPVANVTSLPLYTESFETDGDVSNWSHYVGANQFTTETHNPTGGVGGTGALELGDGGFGFLDEHAISATIDDYYELTLDVKTQGWDDQATYPIFVTIEGMDANPSIVYINGLANFTTINLVGKVTNATGYIRIEGSNTSGANLVTIDNVSFNKIAFTTPATDATLSDLTVDASTVADFDAAIIDYVVELPFGTAVIPTIAGTATDGNAALIITQAPQLPGNGTIEVTAEDGNTIKTYTVSFSIAANPSATLSDLTVDDITINGFDANTIEYTVELAYGETIIPSIAGTASSLAATLTITQASELPGDATIFVEGAAAATETYTVHFTIAANIDATLSDLMVDGSTITDFDAATIDYTVEFPFGTTTIPVVIATTNDANANAVVTDATALPGDATVEVTAEDGTTVNTYTVHYTITPANTDATLSDLMVDGSTITGFDAATMDYTVELPFGTTTIPVLAATATDANANAAVTDATVLPGDAIVEVTAEDGTTVNTYTVHFTITPASTDATLSNLKVGGTTVIQFNADILSYDVEISSTIDVPVVAGIATDANATVAVVDATNLPGETMITVTAEDGTTELVYTIRFRFNILGMRTDELSVNDMYPNPVLDVLNISNVKHIISYSIIDLKGRVYIEESHNTDSQISISTKSFETGMYIIRLISSKGKVSSLKFIKK